jgi:hypothetical protein
LGLELDLDHPCVNMSWKGKAKSQEEDAGLIYKQLPLLGLIATL